MIVFVFIFVFGSVFVFVFVLGSVFVFVFAVQVVLLMQATSRHSVVFVICFTLCLYLQEANFIKDEVNQWTFIEFVFVFHLYLNLQ